MRGSCVVRSKGSKEERGEVLRGSHTLKETSEVATITVNKVQIPVPLPHPRAKVVTSQDIAKRSVPTSCDLISVSR